MKNVIVTGASCFIGKPLVKELTEKGYFVYAILRKGSPVKFDSPQIKTIYLNLDEYKNLDKYIDSPCFAIFHLAWNGTRGSDRNDEEKQESNFVYSKEVLEAASRIGCQYFIGAGSQAEYGVLNKKIKETDTPKPNTAYGIYKLKFTDYALDNADRLKMKVIIPRFFSLFGENDFSGTLIESSIENMMHDRDCNYTLADQNWNYMYIQDAIKAMVYLMENGCSGIYNFGSRDTRKLKDFIYEIKEILHSKSHLNFGAIPYPATGKVSIDPDINKLLNTGFNSFTPFDIAIENIVQNKKGKAYEKN